MVLAACLVLGWALPAVAAPTWSSSTALSTAGLPVTYEPSVAISDVGFGVETWAETVASKSVVRVAQHAPGGAWATFAGDISGGLPGEECDPFAAVDPAGNAAVVWTQWAGPGCDVGNQTIFAATRAAGATTWGPPSVVGVASAGGDWNMTAHANAAGQIVVAWESSDSVSKYVWGSVGSPTGGFSNAVKVNTSALTESLYYLTVAIGPNGDAAVQWNDNGSSTSNVFISLRPKGGAFQLAPTLLTNNVSPSSSSEGTVAIDGAGDVLSAFVTSDGTTASFVSRMRPAANQTWQPPQTIGTPQAGYAASWIAVGLDGSGNATAAWVESNFAIPIPHPRRVYGATRPAGAAGTWTGQTPLTDVLPSLENIVQLTVVPSGAAAISWGATAPQDAAEVLYRPAGGSFGGLTPVGAGTGPSVALAPSGDAVMSFIGTGGDARVSVFDTTPPVIAAVTVPAGGTTGNAVGMSTSTGDGWSALGGGQPAWSFGDGTAGSGASVTHTYGAAGTYTITVSASDAGGIAATPVTRQIVVSSPPGPPPPTQQTVTIVKPKVKAAWQASKLVGTVAVAGTVGANATLTASLRRHGAKKAAASTSFKVKAGKWSHTLKLPPSLAPGKYDVTVSGSGLKSAVTSFTLAAPRYGIVKRGYASGPQRGPAVTTLSTTSELWAHFTFGTLPTKRQTITTQWILPSGQKLAANTRPRTPLVEAQVKDLTGKALPTGRWHCVIRAGGVVVATVTVRLR
jgi:hypothetical protein